MISFRVIYGEAGTGGKIDLFFIISVLLLLNLKTVGGADKMVQLVN